MELNEAITLIDDELFHAIDLMYKEPKDREVIDKIRNAWGVIVNSVPHKPSSASWVMEYDSSLVCSECGENEFIHYNYTCFHNGEVRRDDEGVWCDSCNMNVEMIEPS